VIENIEEISYDSGFYKQLYKKVLFTASIVIAISLSYTLWTKLDSNGVSIPFLIVVLAFVKSVFIVRLTHFQLSKIIGESHQLMHVLTLFGTLILLIVLSFSVDYQTLYVLDSGSYTSISTLHNSFFLQFFEFLYFSLITFSSVGFGDIVPLTLPGKFLVLMEMFLSFLVLVFGIVNVNRIRVNK